MTPDDWRWHVLRVEPARELTMADRLRELGQWVFCPISHAAILRQGERWLISARAQYSGYLFLGQEPGGRVPWADVLDLDHVRGVLGPGGAPMDIPELGLLSALVRSERIVRGKPVRTRRPRYGEVISGPYAGRLVRLSSRRGELVLFEDRRSR